MLISLIHTPKQPMLITKQQLMHAFETASSCWPASLLRHLQSLTALVAHALAPHTPPSGL